MFLRASVYPLSTAAQAIAVQTFVHIIFRGHGRETGRMPKIVLMTVIFIWVFVALMVGIGVATHATQPQPLYGNTKWCKSAFIRAVS